MAIVDEIIRPADCFFGMCLPLTKQDFFDSLDPGNNKTYSKIRQRQYAGYNREALWERDHEPLVRLFNNKKKELEELGVTFCLNFSLKDLAVLENYKASALFAHHDDELKKVELFDGMYDIDVIIKHIPAGFNRVLDFTLCESVPLQTAVKKVFRDCLAIANKLKTNPEFRLVCYSRAISFLQTENISYVDAIAKVRLLLINSIPIKK